MLRFAWKRDETAGPTKCQCLLSLNQFGLPQKIHVLSMSMSTFAESSWTPATDSCSLKLQLDYVKPNNRSKSRGGTVGNSMAKIHQCSCLTCTSVSANGGSGRKLILMLAPLGLLPRLRSVTAIGSVSKPQRLYVQIQFASTSLHSSPACFVVLCRI